VRVVSGKEREKKKKTTRREDNAFFSSTEEKRKRDPAPPCESKVTKEEKGRKFQNPAVHGIRG